MGGVAREPPFDRGGPAAPEPGLAVDPRWVPQRGQGTSGLARCGNGTPSRAAKGVEMGGLAWGDGTANPA